MPNWKKVIVSGSDASLNTLKVTGVISGSTVYSSQHVEAAENLKSLFSSGDEGGEIFLNKATTNTTINTGVTIDINQNRLRIFENGGTNRGGYYDITALGAGVGTNLLGGSGTVTSVSASGTVSGITLGGGPITGAGTLTLSGTISGLTNSNLSGTAGITNANLANPSLMVGSTNIALGATGSSLAGLTSISATSFTGSLLGTASYALQALSSSFATTASYALTAGNGGVTQLLAGPNVTLSPTNGLGQVTISSTSGGGGFNTATGSYGSFYSTQTQTNVAGTARSMSLNITDITNGVSISGSTNPFNTYIKTENAGVYDIQFSAQVDKTDSGTDEIWIWLRKNGTDISDSATSIQLVGNGAHYVAAWNFFVNSAANDYYQLMWYSPDANVRLHAEAGFGVVPGIPSLIVTANRVDQFLSNTGSFSGSFTGILTGTASYASQALSSSFATTASYVLNAVSASFAATASTTTAVNGTINYIPRFVSSSILGNSNILQSGSNIGIGTTPQSGFLFDVNGQSALRGAVYVNGPLLEFGSTAYKLNNAGFSWINSGSGNLSIGTTVDSGFKLDVSGSTRLNGNTTVSGSIALSGSISLNNGTDLMKISRGSGALGRLIFSRPNNEAVESVTFGGGNEEIYIRSGAGKITHDGTEFQLNNSTGTKGLGLYASAGDVNLYGASSTNGLRLFGSTRNVAIQNGGTFVDSGYRLDVSGSTRIRGFANTSISSSLVVYGSGSSQPVFTVQGSQGELFSVTDSLSGSLFSVNDISGLPILEAFSDNTVLLGSYQAPALLTTNKIILTASGNFTLSSLPTASYDGAFYDYTARSGSNARAGSMMAIWGNGGTVNFTETTTTDFGNTTGLNLGVFVIGGNMVLTGSASTTAWTIKTIIRSI
jgi:hypothetical protein